MNGTSLQAILYRSRISGLDEENLKDLDEAKRKLSQKQTMKLLDILDGTRMTSERGIGLHHAIKDLKAIDGKVNFNVTKIIKTLKAAEDAFKQLEKLSQVEFDRLDATLDIEGSSSNSKPKKRKPVRWRRNL